MKQQNSLFGLCLAILCQVLGATHLQGQAPRRPLIEAIDKLVADEGVTAESPGVAIFIVRPGKLELTRCYGLANLQTQTVITQETLFELASFTKPMTATAILVLQERGKLSIDDDVRKYVPELPQYDVRRPIRLRDLLHHVSGLPDYMDFEDFPARHKDYWVNEDYASAFAKNVNEYPLSFPTGERYEYNNSNYMLLGLVIARVSGMSYSDFMRTAIFEPAGMKDTFVYEDPKTVRPVNARRSSAVGYRKARSGKWRPMWGLPPERHEELLTVGDGGVWTNIHDAALWDAAWRADKLLKPATTKLMLVPSKTKNGKRNDYGLGFELYPSDTSGLNGFGHSGDWGGFRTEYYRYLLEDTSTIILSNREDFDTDGLWYKLSDAVAKHGNPRP